MGPAPVAAARHRSKVSAWTACRCAGWPGGRSGRAKSRDGSRSMPSRRITATERRFAGPVKATIAARPSVAEPKRSQPRAASVGAPERVGPAEPPADLDKGSGRRAEVATRQPRHPEERAVRPALDRAVAPSPGFPLAPQRRPQRIARGAVHRAGMVARRLRIGPKLREGPEVGLPPGAQGQPVGPDHGADPPGRAIEKTR